MSEDNQTRLKSVGEIVRKAENDFIKGNTTLSRYVNFSLSETLDRIYAYINSKHISGSTDSLGREKPFANIVLAVANIWYRATDIDTRHVSVRAQKASDWLVSFFATVLIRDWMKKSRFGTFLNEWGRVLARFGSAVVKFVEKDGELIAVVVPWNKIIIDPINFESNNKIEILELTEAELKARVETHGYDAEMVDALSTARRARETQRRKKKDTRNEYIKLYELHGVLEKSRITGEKSDDDIFVQQMHVISFVGNKKGRETEWSDYTVMKGLEKKDPYMLTHLIREDDRSLSIGSVESLFEAQWMRNHAEKAVKDQLDMSSMILFQTSDARFLGQNAMEAMVTGQLLIHNQNEPITQVNNQATDLVGWQNFSVSWKDLANEITGVSDSMLGKQPKSGTAWRQTEAILGENYNLFELMTENKGNHLIDMFREYIIPHLKTKLDTSKEITTVLEQHEIDRIDPMYIKNKSVKMVNKKIKDMMLRGDMPTMEGQELMLAESKEDINEALSQLGMNRFFKPSEISEKTWKELLENMEWDLEIDVTGESSNTMEMLTTLNTAMQWVMNPNFASNPTAQRLVGRALELTNAMSPVEFNSRQAQQPPQPVAPQAGGQGVDLGDIAEARNETPNIKK